MTIPSLPFDINVLLRNDFMTFVEGAFGVLCPQTTFLDSPHLSILAAALADCESGKCKRLMILLPPRSGKSIIASAAFPAWVLGRNPHKQIICASYGQDLADKHARDTRTLMSDSFYLDAFSTRLQKSVLNDFKTTKGGFRMATSVGGVLTGRGGDFIIVDDAQKPADAQSETQRLAVNEWYDTTLLSRLNNKADGVMILVMQRLHQDDLIGHLLEKENWRVLHFPAIAEEDEVHRAQTVLGPIEFRRKKGEVLDPRRESLGTLEKLRRSMGPYAFEAQYQQNPQPAGGAIIQAKWLRTYTAAELHRPFQSKLQSWDTANKSGELNDYSVCTTWGVRDGRFYLLDVFRQRMEYPELKRAVREQFEKHRNPPFVVIEDKGSGTQLIQELRREGMLLRPYVPTSGQDKRMRLFNQAGQFEMGRVLLPESGLWRADYFREITTFPGTKHDDQVDSTTQALDYWAKNIHGHGCSMSELMV